MNKRELGNRRNKTVRLYYTPGCSTNRKRPRNAIYLNPSNTDEHELTKCKVCLELLKHKIKFVTEACRVKDGLRIDIISLDSYEGCNEIEIVHRHDDPEVIERYKKEGVIIVYTNKDIIEQLADVFAHE